MIDPKLAPLPQTAKLFCCFPHSAAAPSLGARADKHSVRLDASTGSAMSSLLMSLDLEVLAVRDSSCCLIGCLGEDECCAVLCLITGSGSVLEPLMKQIVPLPEGGYYFLCF